MRPFRHPGGPFVGGLLFLTASISGASGGADVEAVVRQARGLFESGEYNAGILVLEAAREKDGDKTPVLLALGDGYQTMKLWGEAAHFYRQAAREDSTSAPAWAGLGRVYFEAQKSDSAHWALRKAVARNPRDASSHGLLGEMALEKGDLQTAQKCFQAVLDLEGENFHSLTDLAVVYEHGSHWDAARKLLQRAEELFPKQPETHYNLAVLESQSGRFHEAVLEANQALTLAPDNLETLRFLGVLYFENQVCNEAIRYFRRVLALSPTDTDVRIGLASCLHEQGHSDEAVQELESAMNETPRDYDLLLLMANIRLEQNRLDDALRTATRAAALDSLRPDAQYLVGLTLRRMGREPEAARVFAKVERLRARSDSSGVKEPN